MVAKSWRTWRRLASGEEKAAVRDGIPTSYQEPGLGATRFAADPAAARAQAAANSRQVWATTKQSRKPMNSGSSAETAVHLALPVSFQIV
jgi:hypothetical protein